MLTGIEKIQDERQEQIEDHGRTIANDVKFNDKEQLRIAAMRLLGAGTFLPPIGWDQELWSKMSAKDYEERLIIAGALIAAEIDRINH